MQMKILVNLTYFRGLQIQKPKKYISFSDKLGVLFTPNITFLVIFPICIMLILKSHQIWVSWVIKKILMCHMSSFKRKFFEFLSMAVFLKLLRYKKKLFPLTLQILLFWSLAIIERTNYCKNWQIYAIMIIIFIFDFGSLWIIMELCNIMYLEISA